MNQGQVDGSTLLTDSSRREGRESAGNGTSLCTSNNFEGSRDLAPIHPNGMTETSNRPLGINVTIEAGTQDLILSLVQSFSTKVHLGYNRPQANGSAE